jgi:hypothetical protein
MSASLVYIRSQKGIEAQIWPDDMPTGGALGKSVIQQFELTAAEARLSLRELERIYPPPQSPDEPEGEK